MNLKEAIVSLRDIKKQLDEAAAVKTKIQKEFDRLSIEVIPDLMAEQDITNIKIDEVGRIALRDDIRCSVPSGNSEALYRWLQDNGHDSLITNTVNASTLKAFVKEQIRHGNSIPEGLLKLHPYTRAVLTK